MVKLYSITILYKGPQHATSLSTAYDLSSFSFFQRGNIQEFMSFVSKTIVERTHVCSRQSVKEGAYLCHAYVRADNLAGVIISDHEYPHRVSHTLITKILDEFAAKSPPSSWPTQAENSISFPQLNTYLARYQNPREADAMTKIQEELEETKIIMHSTIEAVLQRGEKLDDLVSKSEDLTLHAKEFYKIARKTNSCCNLG
ncbi:hypothetical protein B566_EDAN017464 [Ephemera danica]|nr:hypothetical protein B566_EDAN017464 [Ephemera danica]